MRTKTLLLTAALGAAGVASSMAQAVYSVNAVGYVNTILKPGFNLVSNPLDAGAGNNTLEKLFSNVSPTLPNLLTVYYYNGTRYLNAAYDDIDLAFKGEAVGQVINPGDGVFVLNPESTDLTVTFVGEVPQGNLVNPLPAGFSIQASQVPQAGRVTTDLGFPPAQADTIYKYNTTTKRYENWAYDDLAGENGAWTKDGQVNEPSLTVGEAFFLLKGTAGSWNRTFSVNP
jgi:hypothetical protein